MVPDLTAVPGVTACPSCGAAARSDAQWCTLCFASFRAPEPVVEALPAEPALLVAAEPAPEPAVTVPIAAAPADLTQVTWPCATCGAANPMLQLSCGTCGYGFLGRESAPKLVLPLVGDLFAMSRRQRLGVAAGAVAALLLPLALLTFLLTGAPPPASDGSPAPSTGQVQAP